MRFAPRDKAARIASRWKPENSTEIAHPRGRDIAVVYCAGTVERPTAVCYVGTSFHSAWNFVFRSQEARDRKIIDTFKGIDEHERLKAQWRTERDAPHTLKVGDIVYNSWGYDQTNLDWYVVTKTSTHYVWLQEIAATTEETGFMSGKTVPVMPPTAYGRDGKPSPIEMHKASATKHGNSVNFKHGAGCQWRGEAQYCSWYA